MAEHIHIFDTAVGWGATQGSLTEDFEIRCACGATKKVDLHALSLSWFGPRVAHCRMEFMADEKGDVGTGVQTWNNVTVTQYTELEAETKSALGIAITGESGKETYKGVALKWSYENGILTIAVLSRKWYDPSIPEIMTDIGTAVQKVLASTK
jgi:hypothetical protein